MDIRDMLQKLTLLEGSGIDVNRPSGTGLKATGGQGVKPTGDLKHGMPMRLNTASPTGRAPTARLPEADVEEGNRFTGELMKARAAGKKTADLDGDGDMEPVKEAKKAKPDFLDVDGDGDRKEPFKKAVKDKGQGKKDVKENLRLVRETALGDRSLRVYHDREYQEYHVCVVEGNSVISRQFAGSGAEATALVRDIISEARGMKVVWPGSPEHKAQFGQDRESFRKKYAPSVMRDPAQRADISRLDTEYEAGKKSYGRDEEGDDEDEGKKKAAATGEKRGRGRPKGSKRAIGAKGPSGRSKLLTRENQPTVKPTKTGFTASAPAGKQLSVTMPTDRPLRPKDVRVKEGQYPNVTEEYGGSYKDVDSATGDRLSDWLQEWVDYLNDSDDFGLASQVIQLHDDFFDGKVGFDDVKEFVFDVGNTPTSPLRKDFIRNFAPNKVRRTQGDLFREGDASDYSAKKARAGKDIGRPGKNFAKIAKSAAQRYGSKERGEKVAGAVLSKLRKEDASELAEGNFRDVDDKTGQKIGQWLEYHADGVFDERPEIGNALIKLMNQWDTGSMRFRDLKDAVLDMFDARDWQRREFIQKFAPNKVRTTQPELFDDEQVIPGTKGMSDEERHDAIMKRYPEARRTGKTPGVYTTKAGKLISGIGGVRKLSNKLNKEDLDEKAVSKAQRAAAGIARAAQKGEIPKSELRGASKEMARMPAGELKKFAKTREKDLPEKVKEGDIDPNRHPQTRDYGRGEDEPRAKKPAAKKPAEPKKPAKKDDSEEKVSETTTSGSVATAPAEGGAKSKGGIQFGKGVYEARLAESFDAELDRVVSEGTTITINSPDSGEPSVSINGTGEDAMALANLLKMAGLFSASGYQSACSSCGQMHEGSCQMVDEDLANSADNTETMSSDYMLNTLSGGLNGPKTTGQATVPVLASQVDRQNNLAAMQEQVMAEDTQRLMDLYRKIS